jgi:molybdate transport system substrate-binding protein
MNLEMRLKPLPTVLACLLALLLLSACRPAAHTPAAAARRLTIFAAASLTEAFTEIGQSFTAAHPGVTVTFNFAGSQSLRTQLEQGAVADVFASANQKEMDILIAAQLVEPGTSQVCLTNRLLVILPPGNPADIHTLADLSHTGVKLVLAAEEVPAGQYARQVLANLESTYGAGFKAAVLANVVSNETNVKQVVTKVHLGEADAGIVYVSDAVAAPDLLPLAIPDASNVVAQYPLAALRAAPNPDLAAAFVDYVLSPAGQAILQQWGFTPVH